MQKLSIVIVLLTAMHGANASDDAVKRCRQIGDAAPRLACYDAIQLGKVAPVAAAVAAPAAAPAAAPKAPSKAEDFGLAKKAPAAETDVIESQTATSIDGWNSGQVIALANNQKWQIIDGSSAFLGKSLVRKVKIRRGRLGGFFMEFEGLNQTPRVKRIE
jgi:hypothetical protein